MESNSPHAPPRVFYRLIENKEPTARDMLSQGARRQPCPRPDDPAYCREWDGLSVFGDEEELRDFAENFTKRGRNWVHGEYIATLEIPDGAPITYVAPKKAGTSHWLLYAGDGRRLDESHAPMLIDWVVRVVHGPSAVE